MILLDVLLQIGPDQQSNGTLWGWYWNEIGVLLSAATLLAFVLVLLAQIRATSSMTRSVEIANQQLVRLRPVLDIMYSPNPAPADLKGGVMPGTIEFAVKNIGADVAHDAHSVLSFWHNDTPLFTAPSESRVDVAPSGQLGRVFMLTQEPMAIANDALMRDPVNVRYEFVIRYRGTLLVQERILNYQWRESKFLPVQSWGMGQVVGRSQA
ncbi:MAG TPA: hypothetical protein DHW65_02745 [Dehalococcoidia bacterium]|nr:hypothetical protein [Chloroflexota bacterium]HCL25252.1 hypothetical protein [Dehalococcoidia bacterium]